MRRLAEDKLAAADMVLRFNGPGGGQDLALDPDVRREVLLVFKEAINNVVRHSEGTEVEVDLRVERGRLRLLVRDNGRGFDPALETEGNGLASMRRRAAGLGAELLVDSAPGRGATVTLSLARARRV